MPDTIAFTINAFPVGSIGTSRIAVYTAGEGLNIVGPETGFFEDGGLPVPEGNFDFQLLPISTRAAYIRYSPFGEPRQLFRVTAENGVQELAAINGSLDGSRPEFGFQGALIPLAGAEFGPGFVDGGAEGVELVRIGAGGRVSLVDTDPAAPGVQTLAPGPGSSQPRSFVEADGRLFFNATTERGTGLFYLDRDGRTVVELDAAPDIPNVQALPVDLSRAFVFEDDLYALSTRETLPGTTRGLVRIDEDLSLDYVTVELNGREQAVDLPRNFVVTEQGIVAPGLITYGPDGSVDAFDFDPDREGTQTARADPLARIGDAVLVDVRTGDSPLSIFDGQTLLRVTVGESLVEGPLGTTFRHVGLGDAAFFVGENDARSTPFPEGRELWRVTRDGVASQVDFDPVTPGIQTASVGPRDGGIDNLLAYGDLLYFTSTSPTQGVRYHTVDEAGTVTTLVPGRGFAPGTETVGLLLSSPLGTIWLPVGDDVLVTALDGGLGNELLRVVDGRFDRIDVDPATPGIQPAGGDVVTNFFGVERSELTYLETPVFGSGPGGGEGPRTGEGLTPDEARDIALLYETGLDRDGVIDPPGLNFWIDAREGVLPDQQAPFTIEQIADAFLASPEFEAAFGNPGLLGDRELVERFYENTLGREGDPGGIEFWTNAVAQEDFSRADLLFEFAVSVENAETLAFVDTLTEVAPGEWDFVG